MIIPSIKHISSQVLRSLRVPQSELLHLRHEEARHQVRIRSRNIDLESAEIALMNLH